MSFNINRFRAALLKVLAGESIIAINLHLKDGAIWLPANTAYMLENVMIEITPVKQTKAVNGEAL